MGLLSFMVSNRWIMAVWLLPISFLYDCFWYLRAQWVLYQGSAPAKHGERVKYVQKQVRDWRTEGKGRKMCTARPQWMSISQQRINYKSKSYRVEVNLMDILTLDEENMIVTVEPLVNILRLMQFLVPRGYTIPIVPEIGDLTVGGLVMGGGIESTSHKYGVWHNICKRFEIVVADGSLQECTPEKNSDLYWAIPWSYGTFGFLTAVDLMIIPYKPYIKLVYRPTFSLDDSMEIFDRETKAEQGNDSVEGIMFSRNESVIMTGTFVEESQVDRSKVNRMGLWFKPWFYKHVKKHLKTGQSVEYIPTMDFFFRHNKPFFWLTHIWVPFGDMAAFRYLFGWLLPYNYGLLKLINENLMPKGVTDNFVVQDFGIPSKYLKKAVEYYHEEVEIYPLWLCPALALETGPVQTLKDDDPIHIDIGIYGFCEKKHYEKVKTIRKLEKFARDHNGYQGLYAEVMMTYEEFLEMFDGRHYMKMRKKLPLTEEAFPETYEKISKLGRS